MDGKEMGSKLASAVVAGIGGFSFEHHFAIRDGEVWQWPLGIPFSGENFETLGPSGLTIGYEQSL